MNPRPTGAVLAACLMLAVTGKGGAQPAGTLLELSIEELAQLRVVSVSRRDESLAEAPAAVFVITRDDIRRAGVQSIPEALRLAPGVEVARGGASDWTITMRGFNSDLSNKLLVLIDGRSVYSPLYAGVFWDVQDTLLADIDRIEVISGPGGTMWGANAVNGVINIITRPAWETQGGHLELGGGNERYSAAVRYGGRLSESVAARAYVKHFDRDASKRATGEDAFDDAEMTQVGFRSDWDLPRDRFTLQGDVYSGGRNAMLRGDFALGTLPGPDTPGRIDLGGGNVRGYWHRTFAGGGLLRAQVVLDRTERDIPGSFGEDRDTMQITAQHTPPTVGRHQLLWGGGTRVTRDDIENTTFTTFTPESRTDRTYNVFLQDRIDVWGNRLFLTLGTKLEHNDYTGFEHQPNVRLNWHIDRRRMLWAAVSRAVRVPARVEHDVEVLAPVSIPGLEVPLYVNVRGSESFRSESLLAYELGYRATVGTSVHLDVALFEHRYDHLLTNEPGTPSFVPGPPAYLLLPIGLRNELEGETYGGTVAVRWQPLARWQLNAQLSRLMFDLLLKESDAVGALDVAGNSPRNQVSLHSFAELGRNLSFHAGARYVDELPNQGVPSYTALDASLIWRPKDNLRASLIGRNLNDSRHAEFGTGNEIERSVDVRVEWSF